VAAEEAGTPRARAPAGQVGGGADEEGRVVDGLGGRPSGTTSATTQVTLSELPASRLARTSSTAAKSGVALDEDVGEPVVVEDAAGAVAAEQEPVAGAQLLGEQVGLDLVDAVERLEDQVAVRVDPRLLLGDPALVDQALDERVVAW
jgi:hypothetical protein